ncbi:MAG: MotA/TolQ/ExbB proton channel family protein [Polyangiaceae bacterium]|nr:MotA/TolQ/ExbB proton channel family protein [Polyangiaceae bacterium]
MLVERLLRIALLGSSWVMYLLLILSVYSIAAMIERVLYFRKNSGDVDALADALVGQLAKGDTEGAKNVAAESRALEARVIGPALDLFDGGPEAFSDAVDGQFGRCKKDLERGMTYLGTLGSNAPFIGLFGTVIGVIEAFHQLGDGANKAAMGNVMSGIAEALVATGIGLFVAIPAVIAYNVMQKKIGAVETNIAMIAKQITATMKAADRAERITDAHKEVNTASNDIFIPAPHASSSCMAEAE